MVQQLFYCLDCTTQHTIDYRPNKNSFFSHVVVPYSIRMFECSIRMLNFKVVGSNKSFSIPIPNLTKVKPSSLMC